MNNFNSKTALKVINYFLNNLDKSHYINELAEMLNLDPGNLFRQLQKLENEGVLVSEFKGRQKYFGLNKKYPLLKEFKKTFEYKYGFVSLLKNELSKLMGLRSAYIFGSYADDSFKKESDIDVLLVGSHSSLEAKKLILPLQNDLKREINIIDFSPEEFKKEEKSEFLMNVFSKKYIKLI